MGCCTIDVPASVYTLELWFYIFVFHVFAKHNIKRHFQNSFNTDMPYERTGDMRSHSMLHRQTQTCELNVHPGCNERFYEIHDFQIDATGPRPSLTSMKLGTPADMTADHETYIYRNIRQRMPVASDQIAWTFPRAEEHRPTGMGSFSSGEIPHGQSGMASSDVGHYQPHMAIIGPHNVAGKFRYRQHGEPPVEPHYIMRKEFERASR